MLVFSLLPPCDMCDSHTIYYDSILLAMTSVNFYIQLASIFYLKKIWLSNLFNINI